MVTRRVRIDADCLATLPHGRFDPAVVHVATEADRRVGSGK